MAGRYCEAKIKMASEKVSRKMGFGPNLGWELVFGTPLHDPLLSLRTADVSPRSSTLRDGSGGGTPSTN